MCFGTMNCRLRIAAMNCESTALSLTTTLYAPEGPDRENVVVRPGETDEVHRLVLLTRDEAVDDVGGRERLAVRPLDAVLEVEGEGLVPVRPLPLFASHGYTWPPPASVLMISGS